MKKVKVEIVARVQAWIEVPDETTDYQIENGLIDIYFHPLDKNNEDTLHQQKEDLGSDEAVIIIIEEN